MHGFLEMAALVVSAATGTGLLLAGVIAATLAAEHRAADRPAVGKRPTSDEPTGGRAARLSPEGRRERVGRT
jgi:hypothetical protein